VLCVSCENSREPLLRVNRKPVPLSLCGQAAADTSGFDEALSRLPSCISKAEIDALASELCIRGELFLSVCVLCGSPVWPSPPVVGPLRGPPLCVGPLCVESSPDVFPFPVASVPRFASRSRSRSRCVLMSKP